MESKSIKIIYLRLCYWLPAILDVLLAGDLILYLLFGTTFYLNYSVFTPLTQYFARQVIPLVIGWTILLLWGVQKPLERKFILLLTALPLLLLGILLDLILLILGNEAASLENNLISLAIQAILMFLILMGYFFVRN
ncbi:MAG: hypothetical protein EU539_02410 [Promethearchaeota archaeon]|nr:MAG: hypothetical protein EU539_02410 [Candidatus Lokiarchaeota archaeon]